MGKKSATVAELPSKKLPRDRSAEEYLKSIDESLRYIRRFVRIVCWLAIIQMMVDFFRWLLR